MTDGDIDGSGDADGDIDGSGDSDDGDGATRTAPEAPLVTSDQTDDSEAGDGADPREATG